MSKSFHWGTDAQVYSGARNFSALISRSPSSYGLSESQASDYAAIASTWMSAYEAAVDPMTRTKGKIAAKEDALQAVRIATGRLAKIIDGTATVSDQQKIDLGLSVRGPRRKLGAPGTPSDIKVTLSATGALTLTWKCTNPGPGTIYEIHRSVAGGAKTYLGSTGQKKFTDDTLPASSRVTYTIQAVRSRAKGEWASFNVNFGVGPTSAATTPKSDVATVKLAA